MNRKIIVETSATIANFGPGFDTFGLCIDRPKEIIEIELCQEGHISIDTDASRFPVSNDPLKNTASVAAAEMLRLAGKNDGSLGFRIKIRKDIRPGSGLGSSAASAVGGAFGAAILLGIKDKTMILRASAKGESVSSGSQHLDNVSPCLYGGFTVVLDHDKLDVLRIKPMDMSIVLCLPEIVVETSKARELIPEKIPVKASIAHSSWASGIIHGMKSKDIGLIARCLRDEISVPARKKLIVGYDDVQQAAIDAGALSFSISGSGPAVYSLAERDHRKIGEAMTKRFSELGVKSEYFIAKPGNGTRVRKSK